MNELELTPPSYSVANLKQELKRQLPGLLRGVSHLLPSLSRVGRLGLGTRLAVQLRLGRLMGCPVCLRVFPPLGGRLGLSPPAILSAVSGRAEYLSAEAYGAIQWVEAVIDAGAGDPEIVPAAAAALTSEQRAHLSATVRAEKLVHAAGLMFLPHVLIERALKG